jgi:hypothetical protein
MRYLALVHAPEGAVAVDPAMVREFVALRDEMRDAGVYLGSGQLQPVDSATTIRFHDGEPLLTDGPFAELKEHVAGFMLLDCPDLDEALRWAARLPGARAGGAVEVRPLVSWPD